MTANQTCGQAAIALLEAHGVDTVFGIPGVHTLEFYRGLAGSRIRHIAVRHEQGAGFMADGYARASGRPGVCLVITGPGLTNALGCTDNCSLARRHSPRTPASACTTAGWLRSAPDRTPPRSPSTLASSA